MKWLVCLLLTVSCAGHAIIIRHDVADSDYTGHAKNDKSTVSFYGLYKGKDVVLGTGSIITEQWVVTAAHVANVLQVNGNVEFQNTLYHIEKVIRHPLWKDQQFPNDIALVKLRSAVKNAHIARLGTAQNEVGAMATFVGRGDYGNGVAGITGADQKLRAANNVVTSVQEQWLQFVFDQGESALPLEGISGPGDSGGPAYLYLADTVCLIGVSSWQNAEATAWQEAKYGVVEHYSRISYFHSWIQQTLLQENQQLPEACPSRSE